MTYVGRRGAALNVCPWSGELPAEWWFAYTRLGAAT